MRTQFHSIALLFLGSLSSALQAAELVIDTSNGITLSQVDLPSALPPVVNSSTGLMEVNLTTLRGSTGQNSGYVNLYVDGVWRVRNFPVLPDSEYPYSHLATKFDLGVSSGTELLSLNATATLSDMPKLTIPETFPTLPITAFPISNYTISQGGGFSAPPPPSNDGITFPNISNNERKIQIDHPNFEVSGDQSSAVMAAGFLKFLDNTSDLELPNLDPSAVYLSDELIEKMRESFSKTFDPEADNLVAGIQGSLQYLADNDLQDRVETKHWSEEPFANLFATNGDRKASSGAQGSRLTIEKILSLLNDGEACQLTQETQQQPRRGHTTGVVGAGYTAGQPFLITHSDLDDTSDSRGAGASGFIFTNLHVDVDLISTSPYGVAFASCQRFVSASQPTGNTVPPADQFFVIPGAEFITAKITDPAGHSCCIQPPSGLVELTWDKSNLDLTPRGFVSPKIIVDASGKLNGSSTSTVAGFPDVRTTVTGQLFEDKISLKIVVGDNGALPQGAPITFETEITPKEPWPWLHKAADPKLAPAVRINGFRGTHSIKAGEPVSIGVSLQPGTNTESVDWWLVLESQGSFFSFDAATFNWVPGIAPVISAPAMSLGATTLFTFKDGLPPADYQLYFGLDPLPNGVLDLETLVYDTTKVSVTGP